MDKKASARPNETECGRLKKMLKRNIPITSWGEITDNNNFRKR